MVAISRRKKIILKAVNMKRLNSDNAKMTVILLILIPVVKMIDYLPWWAFVVPVLALGIVAAWRKWQVAAFQVGFLCGLITWLVGNLYLDARFNGVLLDKIGVLFSVSRPVVLLTSGIIGGLLTGLALFTGKTIFFKQEAGLSI